MFPFYLRKKNPTTPPMPSNSPVDIPPRPSHIVQSNCDELILRERAGIAKYGATLGEHNLPKRELLQHLLEELLDGANYIQACLQSKREDEQESGLLIAEFERALNEASALRVDFSVDSSTDDAGDAAIYGRDEVVDFIRDRFHRIQAQRVLRALRRSKK